MRSRQKKTVGHTDLQRCLQDALSAGVGWTVIPPEAWCTGPAGTGGVNWALETGAMDDAMRMQVAWFQSRYDLDPASCAAGDGPHGPPPETA